MQKTEKKISLPKLKETRDRWLKTYHNIEFYDSQKEVSDAILEAVFLEKGIEIPVEFARQSGKTTCIVHTVEFIICFFKQVFGRGIRIGIFAPQKEQAKTDYDRLKSAFYALKRQGIPIEFAERNATTLRPDIFLPESINVPMPTLSFEDGNEVYIFPVSKTSHPESKTLDLMIFEEAQNVDDFTMKNDIFPMGAATNSSRMFVGTASYQICYFYRLLQREGIQKFIVDYLKVIEDKQKMYEKDNDTMHLNYEKYVENEKLALGEESDEFRAPYKLEWILGAGQFITEEEFNRMIGDYERVYRNKIYESYVGIDTAKNPDSTVVEIIGYDKEKKKKKVLNWLELQGDNYQDQFDIIWETLGHYNIVALAIDATGQGDFMPDMFERHTHFTSEESGLYRVKFSAVSKDILYKNALVQIKELLTIFPRIDTKEAERFKQQMLDLQKEYKGNLLSCHHPDDAYAHDDYPDAHALAEYAFYKFNESQPEMVILEPEDTKKKISELQEKTKKVEEIKDHWPGGEDIWED